MKLIVQFEDSTTVTDLNNNNELNNSFSCMLSNLERGNSFEGMLKLCQNEIPSVFFRYTGIQKDRLEFEAELSDGTVFIKNFIDLEKGLEFLKNIVNNFNSRNFGEY